MNYTQQRREPDYTEPETVAPRSQEPQTKDKQLAVVDYLGTITFNYFKGMSCSFVYIAKSENEEKAKSMIDRMFEKDFPFKESFKYTIAIKEVTNPKIEKPTSDYRKKKMLTQMLLDMEKHNPTIMVKGFNKFWNIKQVREYFGLKKSIVVIPETKQVVNIETKTTEHIDAKKEEKNNVVETVEQPKEQKELAKIEKNNKWFCEYNIKLGSQKFRKGTIIEKVDNEIDARKQLDIYIKRNFSKVRSVTKVDIKPLEKEIEYSNEIIEEIKSAPINETKVEKVKTLDEILSDNFSDELLNTPSIIVAISSTKPKQKDFENDFLTYADEGQTDDEIFDKLKKDFVHLKRKNIAIRRVKTKRVFETQQYKKLLLSKRFQEYNDQGIFGVDALAMTIGMDTDEMNQKVEMKMEREAKNIFEKESRNRFLKNFAI
mgnify:CR=1 FL=1